METETTSILQLPLFAYGEAVTNVVELFPAVWKATEALTSPEAIVRMGGINALVEIGAEKVSPLVAYMLATCLSDVDLNIRMKVVYILGGLLMNDVDGMQIPKEVKNVVIHYLHNMREETITALLEVSESDSDTDLCINNLLRACPYGGKYLGDIAIQWKNPISIRQKAIFFIGLVGYVEVKPILERLYNRLEARQNGQYLMDFAPPTNRSDGDLLPYLHVALSRLNER